jgi:Zn-finger nucleic acid-binding protein
MLAIARCRRAAMKCPVDGNELKMTERQGIEIDYCPSCRGVWLDRGELDKIIERAAPEAAPPPPQRPQQPQQPQQHYRRDHDDDRYRHDSDYRYKRKKKSLLDDLFDF